MNQNLRPVRAEKALHAPNAALLIDFDNVTLGIRSDLTKELKTLLGSEIIRGKVAVQRAYADWRRYPQYIVPLSESSIDLIFAPAFGANKKNATDIRLAIDAIELVFTRPEIGTFILLSGDSDFSTMVIKLKEYGKYVIGVGIRESASDLLIQNCDEYYSYNDLAGLTREVDTPSIQRDPWELVVEAVAQMTRNRDVMRSDRLKQVMQQIDPNFDEKNAGFNRFSKFVSEAGQRGLIRVIKQDNGQFDVAPLEGAAAPAPAARSATPRAQATAAPAAEAPAREEPRGRGGRGRGRGRGRDREKEAGAAPRGREAPPERAAGRPERGSLTLAQAFDLLRTALAELPGPVDSEQLRLRMSASHGRGDSLLEPGRFSRLLRQAHDAEVADVRKVGDNEYEVLARPGMRADRPAARPPESEDRPPRRERRPEPEPGTGQPVEVVEPALEAVAPEPEATPSNGQRPGLRFRRGSRGPVRKADIPMVGVVSVEEAEKPKKSTGSRKKSTGPRRKSTRKKAESAAAAATGEAGETETAAATKRPRRPRTRKKAEE
ncbi:MAG: NYN domain-containing protein [Gemmatimonadales bacterium]